MTKTLSFILALLISVNLFGQNFEGEIVYQNSYKSKLPGITDQQWETLMGTSQQYLIRGGDYKSIMNGKAVQWQLYLNRENRLYSKLSASETILWNDAAINRDEVLKSEINRNALEVLGYRCDELILTCRSGTQKFYYSADLKLESSLFEKHGYGNWSEFATRAKALPLKMVIENAQFTLESIATGVKPMTLDQALFQLPAEAKTAKSPF